MIKYIVSLLMIFMFGEHTYSQEKKESNVSVQKNEIAFSIAHEHVSQGFQDGDRQWLVVPSLLLDYTRLLSEKWVVGIQTDLVIESYKVEKWKDRTIIERSYPFCAVGVVGYKPVEHLAILVGGGIELEEHEDFGVIRIGLEPSVDISERWEMPFTFSYDAKIKGYDTWTIGVGISRVF